MKVTPRAVKIVLSLWLLYHGAAVLLMPISSSLAGRKLAHLFLPYASTLGFNTTWNFFSPGPSPMFYLEYEPEIAGQEAANPIPYPPARAPLSWSDGWNRRLYGMRFFALNPERLERFFVPFLCRQAPNTRALYVQPVFEKIEDIERVGEWAEFKDMSERVEFPNQHFSCPEAGG